MTALDTVSLAAVRAAGRALPDGLPGTRPIVRRGLQALFGPPPIATDRGLGDPGVCGPGSASWQVIAEPAAIAGGVRALLLQLTHPLAMAGVAEHSRYREDVLGRLQGTSAYVGVSTFGSVDEVLAMARRVRAMHVPVRGSAPDGRAYSAEAPDLLAWVGIALIDSFLTADRLWSPRPVRGARADAFVAEQARIAALLDPRVDLDEVRAEADALRDGSLELPMIAEGSLPTTEAALQERLRDFAPEQGVAEQGREAISFLRRPPIPVLAQPGYQVVLRGAMASLPRPVRRLLGIRWPSPVVAGWRTQCGVALTTLRVTTGTSPAVALATARAEAVPPRP